MSQRIAFKRLTSSAKAPAKNSQSDHGIDFFADEEVIIKPGGTVLVSLGVAVAMPDGYALVLKERSGLAVKGIVVGAGVIDSGYRGPLKAVIRYLPPAGYDSADEAVSFVISKGDKIVQGKVEQTIPVHIEEVPPEFFDNLSTERGVKGFGSSGV